MVHVITGSLHYHRGGQALLDNWNPFSSIHNSFPLFDRAAYQYDRFHSKALTKENLP